MVYTCYFSIPSNIKTSNKFKITVKVVSDNICPWCFIGKRRLEKAMSKHADQFDFEVHWLPYILQPTIPSSGVDKRELYLKKFGRRTEAILQQTKSAGLGEGINITDDAIIGNTVDSHRLVEYAARQGKQDEVIEGIFKAYFVEGKNLGSLDVLTEIAKTASLDRDQVRAYLESNEDRDWVSNMDNQWKEQDLGGVPFFTFNDKVHLSGAQEPETFAKIFMTLKNSAAL